MRTYLRGGAVLIVARVVLCVSAKWQLRGWTSRSKDFLQLRQNRPHCSSAHCAEPLREPHLVDRPQLIEHDQSLRTCVGDRDAEGHGETLARHRSHDDRTQVAVQFGRRDDDARPRLPDFTADGRIEVDEPDLAPFHQASSESPALLNSPISNSSSPAPAIARAAAAHPSRTRLRGLRSTMAPRSTAISASPTKPACNRKGLGMTTP